MRKKENKRMRKNLKYILPLLLIPLLFLLTGCLNNKPAMVLTITPSITRIGTHQTLRFTLKEANGVGVNLNRLEKRMWDKSGNLLDEQIYVGTEAKPHYRELFGTTYLAGNSTLRKTFGNYYEAGPEGKRQYVMGGKDDNGNSVEARAEYWARP